MGASIIADNSQDGVYSHGLNRVPVIVKSIDEGTIKLDSHPVKLNSAGALEQWDGQLGFGPLNACIAIAIDMVVAALSVGNSTYDMKMSKNDSGISQVFIAINPTVIKSYPLMVRFMAGHRLFCYIKKRGDKWQTLPMVK